MEDISIDHEGTNYLISNYPDRYFEQPSMQTFYNKIFMPKLPAVLTGICKTNAFKSYINKILGFILM